MTTTYGAILDQHKVEIPAHLEADAEVPVITDDQRQGDILILRIERPGKVDGLKPVPPEGVAVVRGEAGGNTHLLVNTPGAAPVMWAARSATAANPTVGIMEVSEAAEAGHMLHPEHGAMAAGPGQYEVRRQVEAAEQARLVAD